MRHAGHVPAVQRRSVGSVLFLLVRCPRSSGRWRRAPTEGVFLLCRCTPPKQSATSSPPLLPAGFVGCLMMLRVLGCALTRGWRPYSFPTLSSPLSGPPPPHTYYVALFVAAHGGPPDATAFLPVATHHLYVPFRSTGLHGGVDVPRPPHGVFPRWLRAWVRDRRCRGAGVQGDYQSVPSGGCSRKPSVVSGRRSRPHIIGG